MKERIAILLGGSSSEREISIKSGTAVYEALRSLGLDTVCIDISDNPVKQIRDANADIAFIALHGKFGEDGTLQAILEKENIPYTGSGPEASRLAMDKIASRKIFQKAGLPVPEYLVVNRDRYNFKNSKNSTCPHFPAVVKPNKEGSSIGLTVVKNSKDLAKAIKAAFLYDDDVIIEKFIEGEDLTVGILNDKPLPVVHIKPKHGIYDFNSKYTQGMTEYIVPADFEDGIIKAAQDYGLATHSLLGCRCFSRVDMRLGKDKTIKVLEVNTIPGLTSTSLLPKAAKAVGIDFAKMCLMMIESAKTKIING